MIVKATVKRSPLLSHPRSHIHYWKCDRPAAFHGTQETRDHAALEQQLLDVLHPHAIGKHLSLEPTGSQGNHLTWLLKTEARNFFIRVEDGPDRDDYIEVESRVLQEVRFLGIRAPQVYIVDATRTEVPFAWQVMDHIPHPDLNHWEKEGVLDLRQTAASIGAAVAKWQALQPTGFGPFNPQSLRDIDDLVGFHTEYADYFLMRLDRHLHYLVEQEFLSLDEAREIRNEIEKHEKLLDLKQGCLVHKDLALWNILGTETQIEAYIDWDDAVSGDAMDDLSLLACFHEGDIIEAAMLGYASVRPLPPEHRRRFWLHLLRNMLVKSVIRVGAGYFKRTDGFFLIGSGSSGADLRTFTRERLFRALHGLREDLEVSQL